MKLNSWRAILILTAFAFSACEQRSDLTSNKQASKESVVSGTAVANEFFKLTLDAPTDWYVLTNAELLELLNMGGKVATSGNREMEAVLDASEENQAALFGVFRHPPGTPVEINPNVIASAERVSYSPGIKRGSDYFFHTKRMLGQSNLAVTFEDGYAEREIGGVNFDRMNTTMTVQGVTINQSYYAAKFDDHIVLLVATPGDATTDPILDGIKLEWPKD